VYYTLNPTKDNVEQRVKELTGGRMAEYAAYTGEGIPFTNAVRLVKEKGEVVMIGYVSSSAQQQIDLRPVLSKQLTVKGISKGGGGISSAINLIANGVVKTDGMIEKRIDFDDVPELVKECVKYPYKYTNVLVEI
jgi:threonine dehydrogenase-like Zn-dependent dehydrogenase